MRIAVCFVVVIPGLVGCGLLSDKVPLGARSETGGNSGEGYESVVIGAGGAPIAEVVCPTERPLTDPLVPSTDCQSVERSLALSPTCETNPCPINRAVDMVCPQLNPYVVHTPLTDFSIAVGPDSIVVGANTQTRTELLMITDTEATVQEVAWLGGGQVLPVSDPAGNLWLFGALSDSGTRTGTILAARNKGQVWLESTWISEAGTFRPTSGAMIDESVGYLTYTSGGLPEFPHLATWDGSCWHDELLVKEGLSTASLIVQNDNTGRPWVAWQNAGNARTLSLRDPDGATESILEFPSDRYYLLTRPNLRILPGGLDGTRELPALAVRSPDGIHLITSTDDAHARWLQRVLPESARGSATGCPSDEIQFQHPYPCLGETSCIETLSDTSYDFGLARTKLGQTFAAWVAYSSEGSYQLEENVLTGEMSNSYCTREELNGSGAAELVVARLGDGDPVLSRFHFDISGAVRATRYSVAMAARGETLLVAATLSNEAAMTYLEIDSRLLP